MQLTTFIYYAETKAIDMPLWRNWLARSAVNRKAGGSSPPRGVIIVFFSNKIL